MDNNVYLRKYDQRIYISFAFNKEIIPKLKTIKNYSWHPNTKEWSFPFNENVILSLKDIFSAYQMEPDDELRNHFRKNFKRDIIILKREMSVRKYSQKTIKAYIHYNLELLQMFNKFSNEISNDDIKNYKPSHKTSKSEASLVKKAETNIKIALKLIDPKNLQKI